MGRGPGEIQERNSKDLVSKGCNSTVGVSVQELNRAWYWDFRYKTQRRLSARRSDQDNSPVDG